MARPFKRIRDESGKWLNTKPFRQEALNFLKNGYYTEAPIGTPDWIDYWSEQLKRCTQGYEVDGHKITGHYYGYLNFGQILKTTLTEDDESTVTKKEVSFPDFWDGDYDYFWALEIARNGLYSKESQVPSTDKEKKEFFALNRELKTLEENSKEYLEIKKKRDTISLNILNRLGLYCKPHLDYLTGGNHFVIGKEQPNSCLVMTPFGEKQIGNLKPNDIIYNSYGSMSKVLNVFPQGKKEVYEITLYDGRKTRCGKEHLWEIYRPICKKNKREVETIELKELLNRPLKTKNKGYTSYIKISKPVEKIAKDYVITPYIIGVFLGDGNMIEQTKLSGIDKEINNRVFKELSRLFKDLNVRYIRRDTYWEYSFKCETIEQFRKYRDFYGYKKIGTTNINPLYKEFERLGINCRTEKKFIPKEYKEGNISQRLELVKGLMDTDGYISKNGSMSFSNTSKQLVLDLQEVLYSLGIQSTYKVRKDGLHIIYINSDINLFYIKRKRERFRPERKVRKFVPIIKITKLNYQEESTCIYVDSEDHCYLTDNYIVTHNSRRKGFSYKSGFTVANTYNTLRNSLSTIGSFDKRFNEQTMDKTLFYLNFFNEFTGFSKNRLIDKRDYVKAGYIENINGINVERGYKSVIDATRTFKDNPDAMRGLDMYLCVLEEAGAFDNLLLALSAIKPALTAGSKITGQIILGGTSGDLGKGTAGYMEIFYNPITYGFMPFQNNWDENSENSYCGYFFPLQLNLEGFYDSNGNSDLKGAVEWEQKRRKKILESSSTSSILYQHMQEFPLCPADAFSLSSYSIFPVEELRDRYNKVLANNIHVKKGIPVNLVYKEGDVNTVYAKPDLSGKIEPIWGWKPKTNDLTGSVVIYEFPSEKAPNNFYKIGYDPYRQNEGTSLASIIVFKGNLIGERTRYKIVAEYYGRPHSADMVNEIALKLAKLYRTQVMVENEVTHPITYFERKKCLHLLAEQPDNVISVAIKNSKVSRKYGCHMNEKLKEDCEKYTNDWLLDTYSDNYGNEISIIEGIDSLGLLEELLGYSRRVNCDRVSALFMCLIQLQEQELVKINESSVSRVQEVIKFLNKFNGKG